MERRPLASRQTKWAKFLAQKLIATNITPNQISLGSIGFALIGCILFLLAPSSPTALVLIAVCVQLRLLCNLMDGMVAIEGGKSSKVGGFFNEVPDRVADALFLVPLGYALGIPALGWLIALLAISTAYLRVLGSSVGLGDDFQGPCAKPHRMAILTLTCLLGAIEEGVWGHFWVGWVGLALLLIGTVWTCVKRGQRILDGMNAKVSPNV